jgi:hypothetical protein
VQRKQHPRQKSAYLKERVESSAKKCKSDLQADKRCKGPQRRQPFLQMDDETRLAEGQREAEDMIVEAYAALLLALLAKDE